MRHIISVLFNRRFVGARSSAAPRATMGEGFTVKPRRRDAVVLIALCSILLIWGVAAIQKFRHGREDCKAVGGTWYQWNGAAECFPKGVVIPLR